jgi:deaminated glutathione amidase
VSLFKGKATNIAVVQFEVLSDARDENLETASSLIHAAHGQGANFVCLPAAFATGLNFPSIRKVAEPLDGKIVDSLRELASRLGIVICAGLLERSGKDVFDSAVLVGSDGSLGGCYRRSCLWEGETDHLSCGTGGQVIETELGRVGLLVSYDLRFPEACRQYFRNQADIIVCVAALFTKFSFPVETLCRARAADNTCFFVFASSLGTSRLAMMDYMGRSMIVDGTQEVVDDQRERDILARAGRKEAVIQATVYPRTLHKLRARLPFLSDYQRTFPRPMVEGASAP